jgi:hypothetical protein
VELGEKEVPWAAAQQENKESRGPTPVSLFLAFGSCHWHQ